MNIQKRSWWSGRTWGAAALIWVWVDFNWREHTFLLNIIILYSLQSYQFRPLNVFKSILTTHKHGGVKAENHWSDYFTAVTTYFNPSVELMWLSRSILQPHLPHSPFHHHPVAPQPSRKWRCDRFIPMSDWPLTAPCKLNETFFTLHILPGCDSFLRNCSSGSGFRFFIRTFCLCASDEMKDLQIDSDEQNEEEEETVVATYVKKQRLQLPQADA